MTHLRFTSNARPMDYHKLHKEPPLWRTPVGLGIIAVGSVVVAVLIWVAL